MLEKQIIETNYNYLVQTVNSAETVINQIDKTFVNFSTLDELTDFESFPNGKYYESVTGSISKEDSPVLYEYLTSKQNVIKLLYILQGSNQCFHSAYLLDYSKDLVLSTVGTESNISQFSEVEYGKNIKMIGEKRVTGNNIIKIRNQSGSVSRVIPLIYSLDYKKNCLIINIDMDMMYSNVLKNLSSRLENELIISVNEHVSLFNNESELANNFIKYSDIRNLTGSQNSYKFIQISGNNILVTKYKSAKYGWTFFSIIKMDALYKDISKKSKLIFIYTLIVLIITLFFGILGAKKFYKPVNNLVNLVKMNAASDTPQQDEIHLIENALKKSYFQNEVMQEKIQEGLLASQERFIKLVLDNQFSKREIIEGLEYFDLDLVPYKLMILLISANYLHSDLQKIENKEYIKVAIIETVQGIILECFKSVTVEVKEGIFIAIFNCSEDDLASVYSLSRQIQSAISQEFLIDCFVGIGYLCSEVSLLPKAYDEVYQAMRRRYVSDKDESKVFYINDVVKSDKGVILYSREYEKLLNNNIKSRDRKEAKRVISLMISKVNNSEEVNTFCNIQYTMMQILSDLIYTSSDLGIDLEKCTNTKTNLYAELLEKESITSVTKWLEYLTDRIIDNISDDKVLQVNDYVVQVLNLIKNNYSMDISLTSIADKLGLNPSYLSRILKEKTGKTFMDYLNETRMENSKKLLLETDINIGSLSEKMSYSNPNYFIKIFRKYTGITPGEFKKLYKK
jgi:Response regulator containing CheY-like receiver domain and AraC-type DNA-binding domain